MKRYAVGAAEKDGKPVPCWFFGEVFVGDCGVLLQPVVSRKLLDCGDQRSVHLSPRLFQVRRRERIGKRTIRVGDVDLIERRVKSLPNAKERQHAVMNGREMAEQIKKTVSV